MLYFSEHLETSLCCFQTLLPRYTVNIQCDIFYNSPLVQLISNCFVDIIQDWAGILTKEENSTTNMTFLVDLRCVIFSTWKEITRKPSNMASMFSSWSYYFLILNTWCIFFVYQFLSHKLFLSFIAFLSVMYYSL